MTSITQAEFARLCDINRSSVSRAIQRGRLVAIDKKIELAIESDNPAEIEAAAKALWNISASSDPHHQANLQKLEEQRAVDKKRELQTASDSVVLPDTEDETDPSIEALNKRIKAADAKKRENDARTAEINRLALEGEYLLKEAVDYALRDHTAILRRELDNLADRLAPVVQPLETVEEVHAAIARAADGIMRVMHHSMGKAKEAARELK